MNTNFPINRLISHSTMTKNYVDLLLISETKTDSTFPTDQFRIDAYKIHRRDRDEKGVAYYFT